MTNLYTARVEKLGTMWIRRHHVD